MTAISTAITQFFTALTVLFAAFSKLAGTVDNIMTVAEESSGTYKDQARIDRQIKLSKALAEQRASTAADNTTASTTSANEVEGIAALKALTEQMASIQAHLPAKA